MPRRGRPRVRCEPSRPHGRRARRRSVPPAYDPARVYRVVFVLHNANGSAVGIRDQIGGCIEAQARQDPMGGIFVYPDSLVHSGSQHWVQTRGGNDQLFLEALLAEVQRRDCTDKTRVFSTGFSSGGEMSNALACYRPDLVRAVAPMSGTGPSNCPSPMASLFIFGANEGAAGRFRSLRSAVATRNGCSTPTQAMEPAPCRRYEGCEEDHPTASCEIPDLGHEIWRASGAVVTWAFFARL